MPNNNHREYTVGWICALPIELVAAEAMLDERYEDRSSGFYTLGRIGHHNVVMACLPAGLIGTNAAATVATKMVCNFPSIRFGLMVGIGGGVPSDDSDIRLGDVVVSQPRNGYGGVVQYDFGKTRPGEFEMTGFLNAPPTVLLEALATLQARHLSGNSNFSDYIAPAARQLLFALQSARTDILFESAYDHETGSACGNCSKERLVQRKPRDQVVVAHYGTIASGNQVMRDGRVRDSLSSKLGGVLCFEMEAAGLMNSFPCLVIRGICDYADSHKNKEWQPYAAITAAAYAKEILTVTPGDQVATTKVVDDAIKAEMIRNDVESNIATADMNWFLSVLPAINEAEYECDSASLDPDNYRHCWVFSNLDFLTWDSANSSRVLWLSGPPECDMRTVASVVLQRETDRASGTEQRVLYHFCSPTVTNSSPVAALIRAHAYQIISSAADAMQESIAHHFLRGILNHFFKTTTSDQFITWFSKYRDNSIYGLLLATDDSLLAAIWAIMPTVQNQSLSVLVAGLEYIRDHPGSIEKVRKYVEDLQRTYKAKVMLTSGLDEDISLILRGLPHIEYDKERKECLSSLSFSNTRVEKIVRACEGTFEWLWKHAQYKKWSIPEVSSILLIEGKPGSGKSTLTKYFNELILQQQPSANSASVARFFYSYRDGSLQRSHHNMLRSILYDIIRQDQAFFYHIQSIYRLWGHDRTGDAAGPEYELLKQMLESLLDYPLPRPLYMIIDAVDESEDRDRRDIIKRLFQLGTKATHGTVKIFVASRPVEQIDVRRQGINVIRLQAETVPDICRFARSMLDGLNISLLLDKATKYIIDHANGVFQWVKLVGCELEASLEDGESEDAMFQRLRKLPTELDDFYQLMLERLDNKVYTADSVTLFRSVFWAGKPVTADELLQAVAISNIPKTEFMTDQSLESRIPLEGRITRCGGNFLEFKHHNGKKTVQIMHQTVREFFLCPDGYASKTKFFMCEEDAMAQISMMCIRYFILCARCTTLARKISATRSWSREHYDDYAGYLDKRPLLNYALSFFEQHRNSWPQNVGALDFIAVINQEWTCTPFIYLLDRWMSSNLNIGLQTEEHLHIASEFRAKLLYAAVLNDYQIAVEIMLAAGTDVNLRWKGGRTALLLAAEKGHESVVNSLLARNDVDVNSKDELGRSPLSWAAESGHEAIARRMLARNDIEINSEDHLGMRPLSRAAERGHLAMVKLLLAHHDTKTNLGLPTEKTPLMYAAENGHAAIVVTLLAYQEAPRNGFVGKTPLMYAAENGHDTTVRIFLAHKDDVNLRDSKGRTALIYAAENGHDGVVKTLLKCPSVKVEFSDCEGKTALIYAAKEGHTAVVNTLLAYRGSQALWADFKQQTPLDYAEEGGHIAIVKLLLPYLSTTDSRGDRVTRRFRR